MSYLFEDLVIGNPSSLCVARDADNEVPRLDCVEVELVNCQEIPGLSSSAQVRANMSGIPRVGPMPNFF